MLYTITKLLAVAGVSAFGTVGSCPDCDPKDHHSHFVPRGSPNPCEDAPLLADLQNIPCEGAAVQSPIDISDGADGLLDPVLDPIPEFNAAGMCNVNVHWHLGAEHENAGEFDDEQMFPHPDLPKEPTETRRLAEGGIPHSSIGKMCKIAKDGFETNDPLYTTEYDWKCAPASLHVVRAARRAPSRGARARQVLQGHARRPHVRAPLAPLHPRLVPDRVAAPAPLHGRRAVRRNCWRRRHRHGREAHIRGQGGEDRRRGAGIHDRQLGCRRAHLAVRVSDVGQPQRLERRHRP